MRFIEPGNSGGSARPSWGDSLCFYGNSVRVFNSREYGQNRSYRDYVKLSSTFDEVVFSSSGSSYGSSSPCSSYQVYSFEQLPTTVEGGATLVSSAVLVVACITVFVWRVIRPIFPTHVFTGLRR